MLDSSSHVLGDAQTAGHLRFFAIGATGYILVALRFERRDLLAAGRPIPRLPPRRCRYLLRGPHRHTWKSQQIARTAILAAFRQD